MMKEFIGEEPERVSLLRAGWILAAAVEMALPFFDWAEIKGGAFSPALYWLDIPGTAWAPRLAGLALLATALGEAALFAFVYTLLVKGRSSWRWAFLLPGFLAAGVLAAALVFSGEVRPLWPAWAAGLGSLFAAALSLGERQLTVDN